MPNSEPPPIPPFLIPLALGLVIGGLVAIALASWVVRARTAAETRALETARAVTETFGDPGPDQVLDRLHAAAATADLEGYFGCFTDDAVFLGTDATERWTVAEFRAYAEPHFEGESAWVYEPLERHVVLSADGRTAWFDERLRNAKYGGARGSGALVRRDDGWRVAHYVLSFPIPNEVAAEVTALARGADPDGGDGADGE